MTDPDVPTYTVSEATELLPELTRLLNGLRGRHGEGNGGEPVTPEAVVARLDALGIPLRDIDTGLVDFPAQRDGRPVWLCWRVGEPEIAWWHETNEGAANRKPLE